MYPPVKKQNLRLVHQTHPTAFLLARVFRAPLCQALRESAIRHGWAGGPATEEILPGSSGERKRGEPESVVLGVNFCVRRSGIGDADVGVDEDPFGFRERVISVNEAAFRGFEMFGGEVVRQSAELEARILVVEGCGVHDQHPIPAAADRDGLVFACSLAGLLTAEERPRIHE
nr:hypothetical protein CFP56_69856 [Quercus suber]